MATISKVKLPDGNSYDIQDLKALPKLTYEWNKEYNAGGTAGYLLIGSFPMYDSNVTIDIDATTTTTYHGTVIIATQNVSETSMGSAHVINVYGDPTGTISDAIRVVWNSGSRNYNVYFVPATWSKNLIHIRAIGNYLENTDNSKICTQFTTGTAPSTTNGLTVVNVLKNSIPTVPSSLKSPYSLTIQGNGTTLTNGTYDGSAAKTVNITPASIGALATNGNAVTATTATNATNIYSSASTSKAYILGTTTASSANHATVYNASVYTSGSVLYGAAWNDYAEYRICNEDFKAGQVVCENGNDTLSVSKERLQPGASIVSDTFGFAIGETEDAKCPIAVSGRVLAYPYEDRQEFSAGDAVCAGPNGTVSKMTREEIINYPERIVGTVSAIPEYETWGAGNVVVDNRIWIKIK